LKKTFITIAVFFFIIVLTVSVHADLDNFISNLNTQAKSDIKGFGAKLSVQFGVPLPQIDDIIKMVEFPADAFMCLQLGKMTNMPPEIVVQTYEKNKRKGWGAIAKELGIKPGSAEFHALKRGDFKFNGEYEKNTKDKSKDKKSKGKGKGKNK